MTGTLEVPINPPAEQGAAHEPADASAAKTSRSKAKARPKSTAKGSKASRATSTMAASPARAGSAAGAVKAPKASRSRATASGTAARRKAKANGYVLAEQEVELEAQEVSALGKEAGAPERPTVEPPVIQSADHEELPNPSEGSAQETTRRRAQSWVAVRSWIGRNLVLSGLAVALVVAAVLLALTQLSLNSDGSLNSSRTSALAAARSYAIDLASYNYKHLEQDFGKVLVESTPAFRQNFTQSSEALKTTLTRYDASATAKVVAAGLVSATTSRAVALIFLNQTVDNTLRKGKSTTESRVEITLLRSGGRWLIDQVSLL